MSGYLMSQNFAERVKATVLKVDGMPQGGGPHKIQTRFEDGPSGGGGGGRLRVGKYTAAWAIGACATVTLWERTGTNCSPTVSSPPQTIESVANLSHDVPANSWVVIGRGSDGQWYLVDSGIEGSCRQTIGGEDITKWTGWDATKVQLLGHDASGCLKWFDVADECEPSTSGQGGGAT